MRAQIAVMPGDGIGKDVCAEGVKVLKRVAEVFGHDIEYRDALIGGVAIDATGSALPDESLKACEEADAVLLGAVGDPKYDDPNLPVRPEQGLLKVRKALGLYANLRPVKLYSPLLFASTLKPEVVDGVDLLVVRELTGGLYFGQPSKRWTDEKGRHGIDTMYYQEDEVRRVVKAAFELARGRRQHVTSVDKANVLSSSRLWREVAAEVAAQYPDVQYEVMLVDTAAMRLVRQPKHFDVLVTENTFGDILTDEASVLAGSMGLLPSASLGAGKKGLYEPIHGSAPSRAGQNVANPIATILSVAMLLRHSLELTTEAAAVERAVEKVLDQGYRTYDIMEPDKTKVGTREMGDLIAENVST